MWLFLYAAFTLPTVLFGSVAWLRLQSALDRSLAARSLLADLDANVFVDILLQRGAGPGVIPVAAVLIGLATMVVWVWLNAATAAAASDTPGLGAALRRGGNLFVPFLSLFLIALLTNATILALAYAVGDRLLWWTAESPDEMTPYLVVGSCAAIAGTLLLVSTVVHDHARLRLAATDSGAAAAYRWALRFCLRQHRRTIVVATIVLMAVGVAWAVYQSIASLIVPTSTPAVVVSLLWGQVWILVRFACRFWSFAAANELQIAAVDEWDEAPLDPPLLSGPL